MNLRVGFLLERLLKDAGVNVVMTRNGDESVSLKERRRDREQRQAARWRHRRRIFSSAFTTTPAAETRTRITRPSGITAKLMKLSLISMSRRHVAHFLGDALHTQWTKTSPLLSDQLMYPSGFGVLNACNVPCFLCECSFYSNYAEAERLRDSGYNLREAYAIYRGLCQWAYEGRPTQGSPIITTQGPIWAWPLNSATGCPIGGAKNATASSPRRFN